jgi:hypothetical protein
VAFDAGLASNLVNFKQYVAVGATQGREYPRGWGRFVNCPVNSFRPSRAIGTVVTKWLPLIEADRRDPYSETASGHFAFTKFLALVVAIYHFHSHQNSDLLSVCE